jgi:hypothetical protein
VGPAGATLKVVDVYGYVDPNGKDYGDLFEVFNSGVSLGTTSSPPHDCGGDPAACGGTIFQLAPGDYSITIQVAVTPYGIGAAYLRVDGDVTAPPPDTVIDSAPEESTPSTTATFHFHATDGSTNFECSLDGGMFASCGSDDGGVTYTGLAVGGHTFQVRAKDHLGNADPTPASYIWTITVSYTFEGFFSPVDSEPMINTVKAGRVIPVKYRLTQNDTPVSDPNSALSLTSYAVQCGDRSGAPIGAIEQMSAPGSSGLQYAGDGNWQYNWKTLSSYAGQCRVMVLTLSSGSQHLADFQFK